MFEQIRLCLGMGQQKFGIQEVFGRKKPKVQPKV